MECKGNRMMRLGAVLGVIFVSSGCVRLHQGRVAVPVAGSTTGLKVSAHKDERMSDEYFKLLFVTIENRTDDWVRFERVLPHFGSFERNQKVRVVYGEDIARWYEARVDELELERFNRNLFFAGLAITGAVVATAGAVSGSEEAYGVGTLAEIVGTTGLVASETSETVSGSLDRIRNAGLIPENHLMASNIAVPPGKFTRKWILLQSKPRDWNSLDSIHLDFVHTSGHVDELRIDFRCRRAKKTGGKDHAMFRNYRDPYRNTVCREL